MRLKTKHQPVASTLSNKAALQVGVHFQSLSVVLLSLPPLACLEGLIAGILAAVHQLDALQALPAGAVVWVQSQHDLVRVLRHGHVTCTQVVGVLLHGCP